METSIDEIAARFSRQFHHSNDEAISRQIINLHQADFIRLDADEIPQPNLLMGNINIE